MIIGTVLACGAVIGACICSNNKLEKINEELTRQIAETEARMQNTGCWLYLK